MVMTKPYFFDFVREVGLFYSLAKILLKYLYFDEIPYIILKKIYIEKRGNECHL